jgi:hypothetical protein
MTIFANARQVAWLKRIALALEARNALEREKLAIDHPNYRRPPKLASFEVASVEDWNAKWRKDHGEED